MLDVPMPPSDLRFMGTSDEAFIGVGDGIVGELERFARLEPDEAIIDIGCGYGRVAHALLRGGHRGTYTGMDILPKHVAWCAANLTPFSKGRYRFFHLDVQNDRYNPTGSLAATDVDLELAGAGDVVLVTSVFTHMWAESITHYVGELAKVLKAGGRILATFFLINDSQRALDAAGASRYPLVHESGPMSRYWSVDDPLHVIGYEQAWVESTLQQAGLRIDEVHLGSWCGRPDAAVYQDTLILSHA